MMTEEQEKIEKCSELLKKIMQEAFQMDVVHLKPPYENFHEIDHGIRNLVWPDALKKDENLISAVVKDERRLIVIKSKLGFYNVLLILGKVERPDLVFVGPFRAEEFSARFLANVIKNAKIQPSVAANLQYIYEGFPYVQLPAVIHIAKQITGVYFPEFIELEHVEIEYSNKKGINDINIDIDKLQDYSDEVAEGYYIALRKLMQSLNKGELEGAKKSLKKFLQISRLTSSESLEECKRDLFLLNDYCHIAMFETHIHPAYILKLYAGLRHKIVHLTSRDMVTGMVNDICHKYCILVKNYAFTGYSKTICDVINYIYLHLDEKLTLALIAEHFKKNAASLSNSFSKEVGVSMTEFIHQARVNEAIKYFNMTEMSVSEVAVAVGFQDFAYFSRLFKKVIGKSPKEYCKSVR